MSLQELLKATSRSFYLIPRCGTYAPQKRRRAAALQDASRSRKPYEFASASWTAPALWRFSTAYQSAPTSNSSATEIRSVLNR